jgi:predicted HAD superfamily phosphohydrolase YqeG
MIKIAIDFLLRPRMFRPTARCVHFSQLEELVKEGEVELVLTDKDDTITGYREWRLYDEGVRQTVEKLKKAGVPIKIISNGIRP